MSAAGPFQERRNLYTCEVAACSAKLVTVDRVAGVTPMMISCDEWGVPFCSGMMMSAWYYRVDELDPGDPPMAEWIRPEAPDVWVQEHVHAPAHMLSTDEAIQSVRREMIDHIAQGGLVLQKIEVQP